MFDFGLDFASYAWQPEECAVERLADGGIAHLCTGDGSIAVEMDKGDAGVSYNEQQEEQVAKTEIAAVSVCASRAGFTWTYSSTVVFAS